MANFFIRTYAELVAAINTSNTNNTGGGTTQVNDSLYFQNDIVLTPAQLLDLTTPENTGTLRFRGGTPANFDGNGNSVPGQAANPINYTLTVVNDLNINDSQPTTAQPSFTIGPFTLQIGNGGTAGGLAGDLRADDGGVLVFNRSVDTTYTGTFSVEEDGNAIRNDVAGTTVTFDASASTATAAPGGGNLAIRASQSTGAASEYELELGGAGDGVISGIVGDSGLIAAPGTIEKDGDGTWMFSGANTYVGTTTVEEGTLVAANNTGLGTTASGTSVENGGTLALSGGINVGAETLNLSGEGVEADPGEDEAGALQNLSGNNSFAGAITLTAAASIVAEDGTLTLSGAIGGAFGLTLGGDGDGIASSVIGAAVTGVTKDGDGTWTLTGVNAYTGATTVSGGTLLVDGSIASSTTSVQDGGTIGGTGTLGAVGVQSGGTFAAGDDGAGSLSTGALTFAAGATFEEQIGGTATGSFDAAAITGAVALGGATLDVSVIGGFAPNFGQSFTIVDNDGADAVVGKFATTDGDVLDEGDVVVTENGRSFQVSYVGGTGNDVTLTSVNTPPTLADDAALVLQRDAVAGNVLTNDADTDGGTLTVTGIGTGGAPTPVAGATTIDGDYGSLTILANGNVVFNADVEGRIAVGSTVRDFFTYTVSDGQGGTSTAQLQASVIGSSVGDGGDNTFLLTGSGTTARGLGGDDTYTVNGASDRVFEAVGKGDDTVLSTASYTLGAGQEIETLQLLGSTGSRALNLTGNNLGQELIGNAGANKRTGGGGADTLEGLGGADTFVYNALGDSTVSVGGRDTIEDFRQAQNDRIDLHLIDANTKVGGNQAFTFIEDAAFSKAAGELRAAFTSSGDTLVSGDVTGDGKADFSVLLEGRIALERGDFIL